jgi:hypothetical protein
MIYELTIQLEILEPSLTSHITFHGFHFLHYFNKSYNFVYILTSDANVLDCFHHKKPYTNLILNIKILIVEL